MLTIRCCIQQILLRLAVMLTDPSGLTLMPFYCLDTRAFKHNDKFIYLLFCDYHRWRSHSMMLIKEARKNLLPDAPGAWQGIPPFQTSFLATSRNAVSLRCSPQQGDMPDDGLGQNSASSVIRYSQQNKPVPGIVHDRSEQQVQSAIGHANTNVGPLPD
jgi:hypothetical protein